MHPAAEADPDEPRTCRTRSPGIIAALGPGWRGGSVRPQVRSRLAAATGPIGVACTRKGSCNRCWRAQDLPWLGYWGSKTSPLADRTIEDRRPHGRNLSSPPGRGARASPHPRTTDREPARPGGLMFLGITSCSTSRRRRSHRRSAPALRSGRREARRLPEPHERRPEGVQSSFEAVTVWVLAALLAVGGLAVSPPRAAAAAPRQGRVHRRPMESMTANLRDQANQLAAIAASAWRPGHQGPQAQRDMGAGQAGGPGREAPHV